jgi:protein-S-isoprenylcysteine O-methyltransferase Ste14
MTTSFVVQLAIPILWLAWLIYWWLSARNVKPTSWREPARLWIRHRAPLILGALLFAAPRLWPRALTRRFLPEGTVFPVLGTLLLAAGLGFSVWARRHIGRNWSSHVAVMEGHTLVRTGPYRLVRHPIYTGILLAFLGMALAVGEWRALVAFVCMLVAFKVKSGLEEQRMAETFPEYEQYRRETAALIPRVY